MSITDSTVAATPVATAATAPGPTDTTAPPPAAWLPATEASVVAIAAIPDVAVRNLWITQTYFDLSRRLGEVISTDHTWCTFAVWASGTAGQSIREEELGATVQAVLDRTDDHRDAVADANRATRWLRRLGLVRLLDATRLDDLLRRSVDMVRDRIADGNTLVFAELAPVFVRLLEHIESGQPAGSDDSVLRQIGLDPDADADDLVSRAFRLYLEATDEPFSSTRSQRVLAANIWAVLHEQQRLQADIAESMDAGFIVVDDIVADHVHRWLPDLVSDRIVRRLLAHLERPVRALFQDLATKLMMELHTPDGVLHLGHQLPPLPTGDMFPPALQEVDLPTLVEALDAWDGTDGTGHRCGASDWSDLHERMTYIVTLFRSRQHTASLATAPFDEAQLADLHRLRLPDGPLLPG
ncbi:MAG: hypothetical protein AAGA90_15115 [Actinomycetota bacterium]